MNEKRYKCPKCKSSLVFHHEDKETVTFECKKCNHVSMRDNFLKSKGLYDEFLQCNMGGG